MDNKVKKAIKAIKKGEIINDCNSIYVEDFKKLKSQVIPTKIIYWKKKIENVTWKDAKQWCKEQGGRMPTIIELLEAYNDDEIRAMFGIDRCWADIDDDLPHATYVNFKDGGVYNQLKTNSYSVCCILDN